MSIEARYAWSYAKSTGTPTGEKHQLGGLGTEHSFYVETSSGCTGSVQILTARSTDAAGVVLSSLTMSTGQTQLVQVTGALLAVWPRVKTLSTATTNSFVVELISNGAW